MKTTNSRTELIIVSFLVSLTVLTLYLLTMSLRLTWANFGNDGGDFLAAILTHGIPHPTGYPTYVLLGILLEKLPWGSEYTRLESLSFIPAAIASGLLSYWVGRLGTARDQKGAWLAGLVAGLAWGLSPLLWSQAVIIEVHGLQSLITVLSLWWATKLFEYKKDGRSIVGIILLAFIFGFGMGNHVTLVLLGPICLAGLWIAHRAGMSIRQLSIQLIFILFGMSVYLYLPISARLYPPINWGNPQTWDGFWWLISGRPYQGLVFNVPVPVIGSRFLAWMSLMKDQFGIIGLVLSVVGAINYPFRDNRLRWSIAWIIASYSLFAILYGTDDSTGYLISAVMGLAIWIGLSVIVIQDLLYKYPWRWGVVGLIPILVLFQVPATFHQVDPRVDVRPADFAEKTLLDLPKKAIILTSGDLDSFPLWYYHFGLRQRPDIAVIVLPLTQFVWYQQTVTRTYPELQFPSITPKDTQTQEWGEKIIELNSNRPVCRSSNIGTATPSMRVICNITNN